MYVPAELHALHRDSAVVLSWSPPLRPTWANPRPALHFVQCRSADRSGGAPGPSCFGAPLAWPAVRGRHLVSAWSEVVRVGTSRPVPERWGGDSTPQPGRRLVALPGVGAALQMLSAPSRLGWTGHRMMVM